MTQGRPCLVAGTLHQQNRLNKTRPAPLFGPNTATVWWQHAASPVERGPLPVRSQLHKALREAGFPEGLHDGALVLDLRGTNRAPAAATGRGWRPLTACPRRASGQMAVVNHLLQAACLAWGIDRAAGWGAGRTRTLATPTT